jgi:hypothetical protein
MATAKQREKEESRQALRKLLKPGDTVYTVLRHVSRSGMMREIDLYIVRKGEPWYITYHVGKALEYSQRNHSGLRVSGCGMDMGFHVVHSLGYALYGTEASKGTGRRANSLRKRLAKATASYLQQGGADIPDTEQPGQHWFGAAGYALNQKWF